MRMRRVYRLCVPGGGGMVVWHTLGCVIQAQSPEHQVLGARFCAGSQLLVPGCRIQV